MRLGARRGLTATASRLELPRLGIPITGAFPISEFSTKSVLPARRSRLTLMRQRSQHVQLKRSAKIIRALSAAALLATSALAQTYVATAIGTGYAFTSYN